MTDASPDPTAPPPRHPSCSDRDGLRPGASLVLTTTRQTKPGLATCHFHLATVELNDTMRARGLRSDLANANRFSGLMPAALSRYVAPGRMGCGKETWHALLGTIITPPHPDLFATYEPGRYPPVSLARYMDSEGCSDYCEDLFITRVTRLDGSAGPSR